MAKSIAQKLKLPLISLDMGEIMGSYVGESEHNMINALMAADNMSPCVLWVDEIEKAFSGIGEEGGGGSSMTRMFGIFLTWMQEKKACIYVVATANNIDKLPPEFLRRGRFDEIFQGGFPNAHEREQILELHVKRRNHGKVPESVNLKLVAEMMPDSENYSGADIESIVKEAMKRVFVANMTEFGIARKERWNQLSTSVLRDVVDKTNSSYHSQKDKLDAMLKKLKMLDARSAS